MELRSNFLSNATQTDKRQPSNLNEEMEERPGSVNHKQGGGYEKQFQHLKVVISRLERMVQVNVAIVPLQHFCSYHVNLYSSKSPINLRRMKTSVLSN